MFGEMQATRVVLATGARERGLVTAALGDLDGALAAVEQAIGGADLVAPGKSLRPAHFFDQRQHGGVRQFAAQTLPVVMQHLEHARALQEQLMKEGAPARD